MIGSAPETPNIEMEITLLVVAHDTDEFRASFAAIERLGGFSLGPVESVRIEDVYLDTPMGDLSTRGWVFRVRVENGSTYLTLKGPSRTTAWGGVQRIEIEKPWSQASAEQILETIVRTCPDIDPMVVTAENALAGETLRKCGFVERQKRQTLRDRRMVLTGAEGSSVAELVLDRVRYHFNPHDIRHVEIEVEATDPSRFASVKTIAEALLATLGHTLRPWGYGKTTTGRILERLLCAGQLKGLIRPDNSLMPAAYELFESRSRER